MSYYIITKWPSDTVTKKKDCMSVQVSKLKPICQKGRTKLKMF